MSDARFVHALALGLDAAWRRLPATQRCETAEDLAAAVTSESDVVTHCYSMIGLQPGADLLLWSLGPTLESLEERAAMVRSRLRSRRRRSIHPAPLTSVRRRCRSRGRFVVLTTADLWSPTHPPKSVTLGNIAPMVAQAMVRDG